MASLIDQQVVNSKGEIELMEFLESIKDAFEKPLPILCRLNKFG